MPRPLRTPHRKPNAVVVGVLVKKEDVDDKPVKFEAMANIDVVEQETGGGDLAGNIPKLEDAKTPTPSPIQSREAKLQEKARKQQEREQKAAAKQAKLDWKASLKPYEGSPVKHPLYKDWIFKTDALRPYHLTIKELGTLPYEERVNLKAPGRPAKAYALDLVQSLAERKAKALGTTYPVQNTSANIASTSSPRVFHKTPRYRYRRESTPSDLHWNTDDPFNPFLFKYVEDDGF